MTKIKKLTKPFVNKESKFLFKRLIVLMIIDSISTIILLEFGCGIESNPITAWFHGKFGVISGQLLNVIIADIPTFALISGFIGLYYAYVHKKHKKIARALAYGILIAYGYIAGGNIWIIYNCLL